MTYTARLWATVTFMEWPFKVCFEVSGVVTPETPGVGASLDDPGLPGERPMPDVTQYRILAYEFEDGAVPPTRIVSAFSGSFGPNLEADHLVTDEIERRAGDALVEEYLWEKHLTT